MTVIHQTLILTVQAYNVRIRMKKMSPRGPADDNHIASTRLSLFPRERIGPALATRPTLRRSLAKH